jgi:two-component system, response regulator
MKKRKPVTVLMAEDDPDDRLMAKEAFDESKLANDLRFVENGEELLDYLYRRGRYKNPADSPRPGLILLDLNMPKKDGREALKEIKSDPKLKNLRIVVLTTSKEEEDVEEAYKLTAASYITKPVKFKDLVDLVKTLGEYWLEIVKLPDGGGRQNG